MEPQLSTGIPQNSNLNKKRGSDVSFMDAEVVEIPPPHPRCSSKSSKKKEVIHHEVIDIDNDEKYSDLAVTAIEVSKAKKGKTIVDLSEEYSHGTEVMEEGLQASLNADGLNYDYLNDDDYMDDLFVDDMMGIDEYDQLQAYFDNMDIPPGVEAPVPWMSDHSQICVSSNGSQNSGSSGYLHTFEESKTVASELYDMANPPTHPNNSTLLTSYSGSHGQPTHRVIHHSGSESSSTPASVLPNAPGRKSRQHRGYSRNFSFGLESKTRRLLEPFSKFKKSSSSSNSFTMKTSDTMKHIHYGGEIPYWEQTTSHHGGGNLQPAFSYPSFPAPMPFVNKPTPFDQFHSHWGKYPMAAAASKYQGYVGPFSPLVHVLPEDNEDTTSLQDSAVDQVLPEDNEETTSLQDSAVDQESSNIGDVMKRFEQFKRFEMVEDHSDHHYSASGSSAGQASRGWAKRIQEEWKILEKDLPDTIFVRVYESRMDLLRAVILGAEGTPYHDGLFFFDVFFPSAYPNIPPEVHYHSHGLRLNPNLYNCGKVCLSLLNTWSGDKKEKWQPKLSTMLQVLVSIQGLVLNAKPYFNEPGYVDSSGTTKGNENSLKYNEDTFILSLRTMTYTMRKPPKYFEELVVGHFVNHAKEILVACKAYMEGAQVGCLVKGGVQDLEAGDKSCSTQLKMTLSGYLNILVKEFRKLGIKDDIDAFLPAAYAHHHYN